MMTEIPSDVESCTDLDDGDGVPRFGLKREFHDYQEVDRTLSLDVHHCTAYVTESECRDCSATAYGADIVDVQPLTDAGFKRVVYELYESFYEDPRSISYFVLMKISPGEDSATRKWFAGYFGEAVDLGFDDAIDGEDKRSKAEVLERVLPPEESLN